MKKRVVFARTRARRLTLAAACCGALTLALLPGASAGQTNSGRPRRVEGPAPNRAAQPTPTPARTTSGQQQPGARPSPTPTPARPAQTPAPTAGPRIEPPPGAPQLKTPPPIREGEDPAQQGEQEIDPEGIVRVETNLVNLQVRVVDRNNRPINDVRDDEFRVFENGVQQKIEFVTREEVPISYGIVVDNSGSLRNQINQVIEASKTIVGGNRPGDETFVVRFVGSDEIKIMQDFTADQQSVTDALEDMFVEGGQTAIIDAVYLSAEHAARYKRGDALDDKRRRALILVTDGEDRASFYKREQLFEALKEQDVQIYIIGFVNELDRERGFISKSRRDKAVELLDRLAKETGGRAFYPNSLSELPQIAQEITKDLRTQYVVSYIPAAKAQAGEFRQVRVSVADAPGRERRIAVTRSGYTGKPPAPAPTPGAPARRP
jgi:Ca-activated chloride channel family protein